MIPVPRKATTVLLLREKADGFEVFLLKRSEKSSFMGGNFVYPGGGIDPEDVQPELYALCAGVSPADAYRILGMSSLPGEALSYWVAGIRELFEEAGVLLAYDRKGSPVLFDTSENRDKFSRHRISIRDQTLTMIQMAQAENLLLATDQLHYYAHWITPEAFPQRFDTRFFLARLPAGQEASHDQKETTQGVWLTPSEAIQANSAGEAPLSPPTLKTLEDLSRVSRLDALFSTLERRVIEPVLPVLNRLAGQMFLVYPWEPEYALFLRGEIPARLDHGRPSRPGENSTRLLFIDGRWQLYYRAE